MAALMALVTLAAACGGSPLAHSPGGASTASTASTPAAPSGTTATSVAPVPRAPGASVAPGGPAAPGGPIPAEKTRCTGWPAAPAGRLPRSFLTASVLRCVTETVSVPHKGQWTAAVLEKADQDLAPLTGALSAASGHMEPGRMCPEYVIALPQIVLVSKDEAMIRPAFPVDGCGHVQHKVLAALAALRWQTVSRRLLAKAPVNP